MVELSRDEHFRIHYHLRQTRMLEERIVRDVRDVDLGLIFGLGFPPFKGGLLYWADTVGAAKLLEMTKPFVPLGQRFEPTPLLLDMAATGRPLDLPQLERLHALKTGALIRSAVRMGALAGGADEALLARLDDYASALGLAFQIRDDILDVEGDSAQLGKTAGKDQSQEKSTYPALLGMARSKARLLELSDKTKAALGPLGERAGMLHRLADFAVARVN